MNYINKLIYKKDLVFNKNIFTRTFIVFAGIALLQRIINEEAGKIYRERGTHLRSEKEGQR